MWYFFRGRVRRRRRPRRASRAAVAHYQNHKHAARCLILGRLEHWSAFYGASYGRVAIRNTRSRWGSCSEKKNLNFNYKLLFLPVELLDYVIVHELCHLFEFNHSPAFWAHVARALPEYRTLRLALQKIPTRQ